MGWSRRLGGWMFGLRSIRARLTLWYLAILAVTLVAFSSFLYVDLSRVLSDTDDQELQTEASELISVIQSQKAPGALTSLPSPLQSDSSAMVYDASGSRLLGSNDDDPPPVPAGDLRQAASGQRVYSTILNEGSLWRTLSEPVLEGDRPVAVLALAHPRDTIFATLSQFKDALMVIVPATLLLALAGGALLASRALDPIDRVTRAAEAIGAGDLSRRLNLRGPSDEVVRLAATFDRMLARIEDAFGRERRFVADASHELRTPLSVLLNRAEVALQRRRTVAEYREVLEHIRQDAAALGQLVTDLLVLARADADADPLVPERLALDEIVPDVVDSMRPLASSKQVRLGSRAAARITVEGDQTKLTQLLINLVGNALKFTPAGGSVEVVVDRQGGMATVAVSDTGIGIAEQHLPHLFERFYRVDKARSRSEGGSGLGLTISQRIAQAHGGRIEVRSAPGKGSTFTVYLPACATGRPEAQAPQPAA